MGKPGRKPVEIDLQLVEQYASQGLNQEQIAAALGVSSKTLQRRNAEESFLSAIKKGQAKGLAIVTSKLFEAAKSGAAWAICFYLKCRGGKEWREVVIEKPVAETPEIVRIGRPPPPENESSEKE